MHLKWLILTYHDADGMRTVEVSGPPFVPVDRKSVSDTVFPLFFLPFFPRNNENWKLNKLEIIITFDIRYYQMYVYTSTCIKLIHYLYRIVSIILVSYGDQTIYSITTCTILMIQTRNYQNTWVGVEVMLRILFNKINLCLY